MIEKLASLPVLVTLLVFPATVTRAQWDGFENVLAIDSGLINAGFSIDPTFVTHLHVGGAAAGDVNGDSFIDVVLLRGDNSPRLYLNQGDGAFQDSTAAAGLDGIDGIPNGAILVDINGDGALDLLLGGVKLGSNPEAPRTPIRLFLNDGDGVFTDATAQSGLTSPMDAHSMALADIDGSGRLDLAVAYWERGDSEKEISLAEGHLWRNLGNGQFMDISGTSNIGTAYSTADELSNFTPNFTDLNHDGWPDLVMAADFETSRVFINQGDGTFSDATAKVISDENGMGAAVGDFDNDGWADWFVTSIWEEQVEEQREALSGRPFGTSGNRLYRNTGDGDLFSDATDTAGVREGDWGWGACAADFDNDGWLDIFMVNGYQSHTPKFLNNPARLFMNNGDGSFTEQAISRGIESTGQGRAVLCFDSNNNGRIDILVQNSHAISAPSAQPQLFRNLGHPDHHWLRVKLKNQGPNTHGVGARVELEAGGVTQIREIRAGNNFLSANPIEAHFGLATAGQVDKLTVRWPDGTVAVHGPLEADQIVTLEYQVLFSDRFE